METEWITLAILRRMDGLHELRVRRRGDQKAFAVEEECIPLQNHAALASAWSRIAAAQEIEPPVLADVRLVLDQTTPDLTADRPRLSALSIAPPPPKHKPTAANPRAYQGTKDRPPKPRRPSPVDLRPFLCTPGGQDRLVETLTARLGAIELPAEFRGDPPLFRRYFESGLRTQPASVRHAALAAYHTFGLQENAEERCLFATWFLVAPKPASLWCGLLTSISPARRAEVRGQIWNTAFAVLEPKTNPIVLARFDALIGEEQFDDQWHYLLGRHHEAPEQLDDLAETLQLLNEHAAPLDLKGKDAPPTATERDAIRAFAAATKPPSWLIASLVRTAGCVPGLATTLRALAGSKLDPSQIHKLARAVDQVRADFEPDESLRMVQAALPRWLETLDSLAQDYRDKAIRVFVEFLAEESTESLEFARELAVLVCRPPFETEAFVELSLEVFSWLDRSHHALFLALPQRAYRALDENSRRRNDAFLLASGLGAFASTDWGDMKSLLADAPTEFCRAAKTLGLLSEPTRRRLIQAWQSHPIRTATAPDVRAKHLLAHPAQALSRHLPKQLRHHLEGRSTLRPGQAERHLKKLEEAQAAIRCDLLEQLACAQLSQGLVDIHETDFGSLSKEMIHALRLQSGSEDNRRGLRRLIRACFDGNEEFLLRHPTNVAWLDKHPKIDRRTWIEGLKMEREIDGKLVRIGLERDPLEALRLGTYVGSCLGLGGSFGWSAAATVLDINKQVVFARDNNGQFLARQILAITDSDRLACYGLYPRVGAKLQRLFRDLNQATAQALKIPITSDDDDTVSVVLAQDWWDDGLWTEEIDDGEAEEPEEEAKA